MGRMLMLSAYAYGSALASPHPSLSPFPPRVRDQTKIYLKHFKASKKIFPWGSKKLRQHKKNPLESLDSMALAPVWRQNRAFLWYLHRFGSGASRP
jgi:hypothetical protein